MLRLISQCVGMSADETGISVQGGLPQQSWILERTLRSPMARGLN